MTRDDIRKLLGGYATGTLSETEGKILFDAALDDQELFDELAQEQALKELLEEPGAKPRLIAALAPRRKAWWLRPWPWVVAAAAAVAVSVVLLRPPARQEIAEVQIPEPRLAPRLIPRIDAPVPPPVVAPAPSPRARRQVPAPAGPNELRQEPPPQLQDSVQEKAEPAKAADAAPAGPVRGPAPAPVRPPAPAQPAAPASEAIVVNGIPPPTPPAAQQGQQGQQAAGGRGGGGGRGGRGGAVSQFAPSASRLATAAKDAGANVAARFAFDYSVTPEGRLRILPAADGFLTVSVSNGDTSQVLVSSRATPAASAVEVPLPGDSTLATIVFARSTGPGGAGVVGGFGGGAPGPAMDPPTGTKTDPAPSPNSRLQAIIPLTPRQ